MTEPAEFATPLIRWFGENARDLPWRRSRDPYAVWISEIMLQQTQVRTVIPYWERWMKALPDVGSLARAGEVEVLKLWEGLGYYRRARHLHAAARTIVARHGGVFPVTHAEVLELPGIGRYTAGAICSIAFDQPAPILDGNVIRVLSRFHAVAGDPKNSGVNVRLWALAQRWIEAAAATRVNEACSRLNQALMELGATVCTPTRPDCERCPLATGCRARATGTPTAYPQLAPRVVPTPRNYVVIVALWRGRACVRQRAPDAVNGGLWEFPNLETILSETRPETVAERLFGAPRATLQPLMTVRHAITRYRVVQTAFVLEMETRPVIAREAGLWVEPHELEALPFTAAHRRIATRLLAGIAGRKLRRRAFPDRSPKLVPG